MKTEPTIGSWIPANLPPPATDDDGILFRSEDVLFTDGKKLWVGHLLTWAGNEYPEQWIMKGPDGWEVDGVTHWMPLPPAPNTESN